MGLLQQSPCRIYHLTMNQLDRPGALLAVFVMDHVKVAVEGAAVCERRCIRGRRTNNKS